MARRNLPKWHILVQAVFDAALTRDARRVSLVPRLHRFIRAHIKERGDNQTIKSTNTTLNLCNWAYRRTELICRPQQTCGLPRWEETYLLSYVTHAVICSGAIFNMSQFMTKSPRGAVWPHDITSVHLLVVDNNPRHTATNCGNLNSQKRLTRSRQLALAPMRASNSANSLQRRMTHP